MSAYEYTCRKNATGTASISHDSAAAAAGVAGASHGTVPCSARYSTGPRIEAVADHATTPTASSKKMPGTHKPWVHCMASPRAAEEADEREDGPRESAIASANPDDGQGDQDHNPDHIVHLPAEHDTAASVAW